MHILDGFDWGIVGRTADALCEALSLRSGL